MACIMIFIEFWSVLGDNSQPNLYKLNKFDLQLFSGEKTEEATSKRKQEARNKGNVAKSVEINSVFIILAAFLTLKVFGSFMYSELTNYMRFIFINLTNADLTLDSLRIIWLDIGIVFLKVALPVMLAILVTSLIINYIQVGFIFSFETLIPKFDKLNPLTGFQRLFSKRSLVELVKSLFKVSIIGYFIYRFIMREMLKVPQLIGAELTDSLHYVASMITDLAFQIGEVMLILAALDYWYQNWEHRQSLKMSKQEVKEEYKQTEGNPQIKSKIRERQRAMALRRMMQEVPKATVVVTNPTHFAVALKYEKDLPAPMVVAKGQDFMAQRLKEIAKENRVVIVENKPLARTLYSGTEIGEIIPPELYQAVAEVLAYVYKLKKRLS